MPREGVASTLVLHLRRRRRRWPPAPRATRRASGAPLLALEEVRETCNYLCDGRRPLSVISADLGLSGVVDFSECDFDHDELWASYERKHGSHEAYDGLRETAELAQLAARARAAMTWLSRRPEKEIAVVSHCAFLRHLLALGHDRGDLAHFLEEDVVAELPWEPIDRYLALAEANALGDAPEPRERRASRAPPACGSACAWRGRAPPRRRARACRWPSWRCAARGRRRRTRSSAARCAAPPRPSAAPRSRHRRSSRRRRGRGRAGATAPAVSPPRRCRCHPSPSSAPSS